MYVFDAHVDTLMRMVDQGVTLDRLSGGHVCLKRLQKAGMSAQIFAVFVEPQYRWGLALHQALRMIESLWASARTAPRELGVVENASDLRRFRTEGRLACLLSLEGGEPLQGEISHLHTFYRLGVRAVTLTWNHRNALADGVGESNPFGLSDFGRLVVESMNELGMIVDVSHLAEPGFWDVAGVCRQPFIASHSNAQSVCRHRRNLTDDQIRAVADSGGVIGVNFHPGFLVNSGRLHAGVEDVIQQIRYLVRVAGSDSVGLGSDYDGIASTPEGLQDISRVPLVAEKLGQVGYGDRIVAKIMGENFYRVLDTVLHK